jgi:flagellar assembly factor FliW
MSDMTKIQTTRFGELEVKTESIVTIVGGIVGFPAESKYVLLEYNPPFSWLQSTENPILAFVVVNAAEFGDAYVVPLPFGDHEIDLKDTDDVAILNLVTVRDDPTLTTVNLKAPVIVNLRTMKGRQVILDDERYPVRLPLWGEEPKKE